MMRQIAALLPLALAACAAMPNPTPLATADYLGADDVETAARLFAIAAEDDSRHAQAVGVLANLAVRPDEGQADIVGAWAQALPGKPLPPMRGRLLGPAYRSGTLAPGAKLETGQVFEGGKMAKVSIAAKGATPIALAVSDQRERAVCKTEPGSPRNCRWTPAFSGRYDIRIENAGSEPVRYFLVIG